MILTEYSFRFKNEFQSGEVIRWQSYQLRLYCKTFSAVVWVCILCRKKQELLSKTGQWMLGGPNTETDIPQIQQAPSDKRPKLERAHSAAEKENQPLQRSGSVLRRQYSEQEPRAPSCERYQQYNEEDPRFYQGELEGLMRTHPHLVPRRYPDPEPDPLPMELSQQRVPSAASANKKHKRSGSTKKQHPPPQVQLHSYSSSEEDLKSTPEYGSDERDSEKGNNGEWPPLSHYIVAPQHRPLQDVTADNRCFTERRKKTVRFDQHDGRQGSQDSHRDSGIDTSSTFTSSEDSTRGDVPKHPLSWQVSADGTRMIGHMILRRNSRDTTGSSAAILGLKVVGGKILENGMKGALIEKVKKGRDEVIEWNGRSLQGKTYQEVADIIAESKQEANVELIVSRSMGSRRVAQANWRQSVAHRGQSGGQWHQETEIYERPHVLVTSPGSPERQEPAQALAPSVGGRIQIRLGFDPSTLQLLVTIVCAAGLTPRSPQQPRNPYCKLFLLPDRSEKSKRRTRTLADLRLRALEITVWDYVRYGANDFLGETIVELWPLDEQPTWRTLGPHEEVALTPSEHLSPPSTGSRFSDSDTPSECEIDGGRERRGADGASVSSVGSSASPPRESDRRSRRDQENMQAYNQGHNNRRSGMANQRSHSAAPCDSPSVHMSRSRSKSPRRSTTDHRSLSPPDVRLSEYPPTTYKMSRFQSRSATATPTGSPKKRQLPQVPQALARALQERVAQDLDDRSNNRNRSRYVHTYRSTGSGWERRYSGLSDSDLANHTRSTRRSFSPERDRDRDPLGLVDFDSDMESVASVTSSAFSTQSERPRGTRAIRENMKAYNILQSKNHKRKPLSRSYSNYNQQIKPKRLVRSRTLDSLNGVILNPNNTCHPVDSDPRNIPVRRLLPNPINIIKRLGQHYKYSHKNDKERLISKKEFNSNDDENTLKFSSPRGSFSGDGSSEESESFREPYGVHFVDCSCGDKFFLSTDLSKNEIHLVSPNNKTSLATTIQKPINNNPGPFQSLTNKVKPDMTNKSIEYSNYPLAEYQHDQNNIKPIRKTGTSDKKSDTNSSAEYSENLQYKLKTTYANKNNKNPLEKISSVESNKPENSDDNTLTKNSILFKMCSTDKSSNASSFFNTASIDSTEYGGYPSYRSMPRNVKERDQDLRDPIEPIDSHHHYQPHPNHHHHHHHHHHHRDGSVKRGQFTRSLSNTEPPPDEKTDGSLSDTAVGQLHGLEVPQKENSSRKESQRDRERERQTQFVGLSKKSSSTSQLSATGRKRRMGFGKRGKTSFTVHRSEEILPGDVRLSKQGSSASSDGEGSADGDRSI
ncbi:hypothetical protein NQ314_004321 [Rhamnusium bicolor]|uniref:PDZ domain-containing protein n=1 Tax=Rhamnusium bicolor TaxID=1586634 RepID=A0AAV8ZMX5_9CUCU|nr:hypothetical protein NQ314_004321 [Rhamnusium bicolor]